MSPQRTAPAGWDLTSATCDDGSPMTNISVCAGETVTCTFTNRKRGQINIHKVDDANPGAALDGAVFTLYNDIAPLGGTRGGEDTVTTYTCMTVAGDCSITNVVPGLYWVVETTGVPGHDLAADQNVTIAAGQTVSLTFIDPRKFTVIVLVCKESRQLPLQEHGHRRRRQYPVAGDGGQRGDAVRHSAVLATRVSSSAVIQLT